MNGDKELLELAAKAAGVRLNYEGQPTTGNYYDLADFNWNPLTDDGDALRLAVKLKMRLITEVYGELGCKSEAICGMIHHTANHENDPQAATRRAIVRAAAEIGRAME
jgi:hypothetical protein